MRLDHSKYSRIVVLTGAGISAGSGLRTYRGPGGVWEEYDVDKYGQADAFVQRPQEVWRRFGGMRGSVLAAKPNAAHIALASWEAGLAPHQEFLLVTQNVDGLHQRAGSKNVVELHGNIMVTKCSNASCTLEPYRDEQPHLEAVPTCPLCGSVLRPDVVQFGEEIPALPGWTVKRALRDCDLFIAIGTSGLVTPAANYVRGAEYAGARTILVNLEPMAQPNPAFKEQYLGPAEEVLPALLEPDTKASHASHTPHQPAIENSAVNTGIQAIRAALPDRWLGAALLITAALYVALFFIRPSGESWGRGWNLVAFLIYSAPTALVAAAVALWRRGKASGKTRTIASFVTLVAFVFPVVCMLAIRVKV